MENISPVYARFVLREILQLGIAADSLFAGTALTRPDLETGGDIAMEDFLLVLENGRRLSGNEKLGLVIGRHSNITALGPLGTAAAIAPTIREGLQVMENFTRLHITYMRVELSSKLHGLSVGFQFLEDTGEARRFHMETAMMLIQSYIEMVTGQPLETAEYHFSIDRPDYAAEYVRCLHSPVKFGTSRSSVELPAEILDQPSPYFNAEMWLGATRDLAQRMKTLEGKEENLYTQYVEALLRSCEPPLPDLVAVAQRLHTSERTLNRRLQNEGTGFRQIKGEILGSWARQYLLETDHSVEAIAACLGYQDAANFRRAFRKAEGCAPGVYRQRMACRK